jgi:hypothetical protein
MARIDTLESLPNEEIIFVQKACQEDNTVWWKGKGFEKAIPLLTNLDLGEMACAYYNRRFKIESLFKKFKSQGFKVHKSKVEGAQLRQ